MSCLLDIFLTGFDVIDGLSFVWIESFQVEELFREVRHAVKSYQVGHTLLSFTSEARLACTQAAVALSTRLGLADAQGQQSLARLNR